MLLSIILIIVMYKQSNEKLYPHLIGFIIGLLISYLAIEYSSLKIVVDVFFFSLMTLLLYTHWLNYKSNLKGVKFEEKKKDTVFSRLEKDINLALEKYSYIIKIATIISGIAAFSVVIMNLLK
ncbi:hypothetical protein ES705_42410 [subsurface metagenome]